MARNVTLPRGEVIRWEKSHKEYPRSLTDEEIDYISSVIPLEIELFGPSGVPRVPQTEIDRVVELRTKLNIRGPNPGDSVLSIDDPVKFIIVWRAASAETAETARRGIKEHVLAQLTNPKLKLSPSMIEAMRESIRVNSDNARVTPGDTVGVLAAEALGGPIQQIALNSFHSAGQARNVAGGVDYIRETINLSKERKIKTCTIHFWNPPTYLESLELSTDIIGVTVGSILKDQNIYPLSGFVNPWWYSLFDNIMSDPVSSIGQTQWVLRLNFNIDMLYTYKIQLADVAETIKKLGIVFCVYSPTHLGIIDVYAQRNSIVEMIELDNKKKKKDGNVENEEIEAPTPMPTDTPMTGEDASALFGDISTLDKNGTDNMSLIVLKNVVLEHLSSRLIVGSKGITEVYPVERPIWSSVIVDELKIGNEWHCFIHSNRAKMRGIRKIEIFKLLEALDISLIRIENESEWGGTLVLSGDFPDGPGKFIATKISDEKKRYQEELKKGSSEEEGIPRAKFKLLDLANHITCDTLGTNLPALFERRDVDTNRTVGNNVHEIAKMFGIGAARVFLMQEFFLSIKNAGKYMQPRHAVLLADFMTYRGLPLSVTFSAQAKRGTHTLALATDQSGMKVVQNAAALGKKEAIRGASAQIMTNRRGDYGTGMPIIHSHGLEDELASAEDAARAALEAGADDREQQEYLEYLQYKQDYLNRIMPEKKRDNFTASRLAADLGMAADEATGRIRQAVAAEDEMDEDAMFAAEEDELNEIPVEEEIVLEDEMNAMEAALKIVAERAKIKNAIISPAIPSEILSEIAAEPPKEKKKLKPILFDPKLAEVSMDTSAPSLPPSAASNNTIPDESVSRERSKSKSKSRSRKQSVSTIPSELHLEEQPKKRGLRKLGKVDLENAVEKIMNVNDI